MNAERSQGHGLAGLHALIGAHRNAVLAVLLVVTCAAAVAIRFMPFDNTLDLMLPGNEALRREIDFLRTANFADKVAVSLSCSGPLVDGERLIAAVDRFSASLGPPLVTDVMSEFGDPGMMEDLFFFMRNAPLVLDADDLAGLARRLTPEEVDGSLRARYRQLLGPEGSFMAAAVRADPLGIRSVVLDRIRGVSSAFGYNVGLRDGRLMSSDGRHALVLLRTPVRVTDAAGSRALVGYLAGKLAALPEGVEGEFVCGHTHTVSNEDVIKRDIRLTLTIAAIVFFLLFLLYFRDAAAGLIFLIPLVSVVVSLNITSLAAGPLSSFVVGLGAVIAGIAVDYGIHVYVGVRHGTGRTESARRLTRPVLLGALTTLSVFAAFLLSDTPGYRQLAWFSIVSIVFSLGLALFVLPHCVRPQVRTEAGNHLAERWIAPSRRTRVVTLVLFVVILVVGIAAGLRVRFDSDLAQLDGAGPDIFQSEQRFRDRWGAGEGSQAMVVVTGPDYRTASDLNDAVYAALVESIGRSNVISLAAIWPGPHARAANAERWLEFWRGGRVDELRRLLVDKGKRYSFSEDAFRPFLDDLERVPGAVDEPEDNIVLNGLKERFVQELGGECRIVSFFPDTDDGLAAADAVGTRHDGVFVVSRRHLSALLSRLVVAEVSRISAFAGALILLVTFWLLRDARMAALALVPAVTGVVWLAGAVYLLGLGLNVTNLIAGIVVVGLCIDYGIFVAYACARKLDAEAVISVTLSAVTTVVGAGALLFARHPALFSIGVTLVAGVLSGYLAAVFVVPSLHAVLPGGPGIPPIRPTGYEGTWEEAGQ